MQNKDKRSDNKYEKKLRAKATAWKEKYSTTDSPYDVMIYRDGEWLNPRHQQHVKFGHMPVSAIKDWLNDTYNPLIFPSREHMDELYFLCSIPYGFMVKYHYRTYTDIQAKHIPAYNVYFDSSLKDKLIDRKKYSDEEILDVFLSFVKYNYKDHMWIYKRNDTLVTHFSDEWRMKIKAETWGLLRGLSMLGIGYWGAINTPCEKENLSWAEDQLFYEAVFEKYVEEGVINSDNLKYITSERGYA